MSDYQDRYIKHQARKKDVLIQIMDERHSNRRFSDAEVSVEDLNYLQDAIKKVPSSCDRQAVHLELVTQRDDKALLGGLLVGGVGWIHRAPAIYLLFADQDAYLAPGEVQYMPYLDAGIVIQQLYLSATALNLHCAYANPNIRENHRTLFEQMFGDRIFCGAFAFGQPIE